MKELLGYKKALYYISFPLSFIGFILPIYAANLGASPIEVGILYSIFSLCGVLIRPLCGYFIDKKGRKGLFVIGLIAYAVVIALFLVGSSYKYILIARMIQSIASSFVWISGYAMIADVTANKSRSEVIGGINQVSSKGAIIGSFIGFTILFNGTSNPFKIIFGVYLITSLIGIYYGITKTKETLNNQIERNYEIKIEKKGNKFIIFLVVMGFLSFVLSMLSPIYLIYLKETISDDLSLISFLFIPGAILSMYLPKIFGNMSDRYGRNKILVLGMILQSLLVITIPFIKGYYLFMIIYTLISISAMIRIPAQTAMIADMTGGEVRGKSYGLYSFATGVGAVFGPIIGTYIYQYMNKGIVFYIQGISFALCAIAMMILFREKNVILKHNKVFK